MIPATWVAASFPDKSCMKGLYPTRRGASTIRANRCVEKDSPGTPISRLAKCVTPIGRLAFPGDITREKCGSDRLVFRVAESFEVAFGASRFARLADLAAVPDQLVRK